MVNVFPLEAVVDVQTDAVRRRPSQSGRAVYEQGNILVLIRNGLELQGTKVPDVLVCLRFFVVAPFSEVYVV